MRCLLDTCTMIWMLQDKKKLSTRVKSLLASADTEVFASTVSFWELSLKSSIGKMTLSGIDLEDLDAILLDEFHVGIICVNERESLSFHRLPFLSEHRDPFDRMLAWQAIKRDLALISGDAAFEGYRQCGLQLVW